MRTYSGALAGTPVPAYWNFCSGWPEFMFFDPLFRIKKHLGEENLNHDLLVLEGWERRFIAGEPRLSEAAALYREVGFEVRLEPLPQKPECSHCVGVGEGESGECRVCFEGVEKQYKIIYTRPAKGRQTLDSDLF
jgi:hypothetical protein